MYDHFRVFWRPSWILTTLTTFFQKSVGTVGFLGKFQSRTNFKHKVNTISLKSPDERRTNTPRDSPRRSSLRNKTYDLSENLDKILVQKTRQCETQFPRIGNDNFIVSRTVPCRPLDSTQWHNYYCYNDNQTKPPNNYVRGVTSYEPLIKLAHTTLKTAVLKKYMSAINL